MSVRKLAYRVWHHPDEGGREEILQFKGKVSMADYRFRINAERLGIDPTGIWTQVDWTGELESLFWIEAPTPEDALSMAWEKAVELIGLRTERVPTTA